MKLFVLFISLITIVGCSGSPEPESENQKPELNIKKIESKYLRWVGDSEYDSLLDDGFELCTNKYEVKQYFNHLKGMVYEGEKPALVDEILSAYQPVDVEESGLIRIRFIVNCKGETGQFRMISANQDYEEVTFDERITDQLMSITQSLQGWQLLPNASEPGDYYQYLIFKIDSGRLIEIMP